MKRFLIVQISIFLMSSITMLAQTRSAITLDSLTTDGVRIVEYVPAGVCSKLIHIEVDKNNIIQKVAFTRGCDGNAKGIGALIKGMKVPEAIERLQGIPCGQKSTSCPDQLANALKEMNIK